MTLCNSLKDLHQILNERSSNSECLNKVGPTTWHWNKKFWENCHNIFYYDRKMQLTLRRDYNYIEHKRYHLRRKVMLYIYNPKFTQFRKVFRMFIDEIRYPIIQKMFIYVKVKLTTTFYWGFWNGDIFHWNGDWKRCKYRMWMDIVQDMDDYRFTIAHFW